MNETQKYEKKETAKGALEAYLSEYFDAADEYGLDDHEKAQELSSLIYDLGKSWIIIPD